MITSKETRYYVDAEGNFLGGFAGVKVKRAIVKVIKGEEVPGFKTEDIDPAIPEGAVEVPEPPADGRQKWNGKKWLPLKLDYKEARRKEYPPLADQIDAIWKQLDVLRTAGVPMAEDASNTLDKILEVKRTFPKPVE